jgi:hypothetical protein
MTDKTTDSPMEPRDSAIELGESRRGLDSTGLPPPRPTTELIGQSADAATASDSVGNVVQQASAAPPSADYAD